MIEPGGRRRASWRRIAASLAGGAALVGAGILVGINLHRPGAPERQSLSSAPANRAPVTRARAASSSTIGRPSTTSGSAAALSVDMSQATGVACRPPVPPGPAHPDTVLAQLFRVSDQDQTSYLLGWQIVPYRGLGTYSFGTAGNLLALEPPAGGRPLGFGKGTVTFIGDPGAGTVNAKVTLNDGGTLQVSGAWICPAATG